MTQAEFEIVADLCEQMHDCLEQPDRLAFADVRGLCAHTLAQAKNLIPTDLLESRCIENEPEEP